MLRHTICKSCCCPQAVFVEHICHYNHYNMHAFGVNVQLSPTPFLFPFHGQGPSVTLVGGVVRHTPVTRRWSWRKSFILTGILPAGAVLRLRTLCA